MPAAGPAKHEKDSRIQGVNDSKERLKEGHSNLRTPEPLFFSKRYGTKILKEESINVNQRRIVGTFEGWGDQL